MNKNQIFNNANFRKVLNAFNFPTKGQQTDNKRHNGTCHHLQVLLLSLERSLLLLLVLQTTGERVVSLYCFSSTFLFLLSFCFSSFVFSAAGNLIRLKVEWRLCGWVCMCLCPSVIFQIFRQTECK